MSARGAVVLDTDVASALLFRTAAWDSYRFALGRSRPVLSFAAAGELLAYATRARLGDRRRILVEDLVTRTAILRPSPEAIRLYARLHAKLTGHLHRGGVNDMWTAACAAAQNPPLPVLTGDRKDFVPIAEVIGLDLVPVVR